MFVNHLTYAYKNQVHQSMQVTPVSQTLTRQPPDPTISSTPTALPSGGGSDLPAGMLHKQVIRIFTYMADKTGRNRIKSRDREK